tara:strand:- start:1322 stop:1816 length:495 start_codon:yes stop_codon:yes gene_type:complete
MATRLSQKHTLVKNKAARPDQIGIGEIAVNHHESGPFLQVKDATQGVVRVGGVIIANEQPELAQKGALWLSLSKNALFIFTGDHWHPISGGNDDPPPPPEIPKPGDGTLSIVGPDGSSLGAFTANQATNTNIELPPAKWGEIEGLPCVYTCNSYIPSLPSLPES